MKRLAIGLAVMTVAGVIPATAGATAPAGPNGDIVFTSGRTAGGDDQARIWTVSRFGFDETQVTSTTTPPLSNVGRHRQPNWSPDHTKIVYAIGTGEIRIRDLVAGTDTNFVAAVAGQDRPTWSPDGTKIAYGNGSNIVVKGVAPGSIPVTITSNADVEERPVWSPDGNTIYYNRTVAAGNNDLYKKSPVTLAGIETPLVTGSDNDWQPAVSPDGSKLCFLRGGFNNTADIWTGNTSTANSGLALFASDSDTPNTLGSLNCVWSPDGTQIAFTRGAFSAGQLVRKNVGSAPTAAPTDVSGVAGFFDGNADWAVDFRPQCQGSTLNVPVNGFLTVPLPCTDQDIGNPANISREIASPPNSGLLGEIDDDADSVVYTPNANFSGIDSFTFRGSDGTSNSTPATITVRVGLSDDGGGNGGKDATAARIDRVGLSRRTWRRGRLLPGLLSRSAAAVGTTISFRLSENARVTLSFSRKARGRRVGRRCVKPTRRNRTRRRCTRYVKAGTLRINGKAGTNRVRFQGRLTRRKRLALGSYRLTVGATDGAGNKSRTSRPVSFRIVRR